jgi:hypothetical protein
MNGATALPCVSTTKPPNTHIMISTGKSQYRLRTRIKRHNSNTIDLRLPQRVNRSRQLISLAEIDILVVDNCILENHEQTQALKLDYKDAFELD